ncbi:MAG TPA: restriction endonuclease subunit S [Candidatus Dormibacteraeota bacterium]|nr:restriction endonuclease subunit S [Candidatus Dormibacteraeota bacterium]
MSASNKVRLDDCCEIVSGATPSTSVNSYWEGDICWATPKDLSNLDGAFISETPRKITRAGLDACAASILPVDSVLFSSRAPIGHVAINTVPMATNQGFKSFVPKQGRLDAKFLYWWLRANRPYLESLGNGATFKEVSKTVVSRIEIFLPRLAEQRRIVEVLDQAEALRAKRRAALAQLNILTQAIFLDLFGDATTYSNGIKRVHLSEVTTRITDGTHLTPRFIDEGVPFIFVKNIKNGDIDFQTDKFIREDEHAALYMRCPVESGDVLYTTVGATYGQAAPVGTFTKFAFQRHIAHLKPDASKVLPEFFGIVMQLPFVKNQADRWARGAAQPTINLKELREFEIPLPTLTLQRDFARRAAAVEKLKASHQASLTRMDALFAALEHCAFRGEL